MYQRGKKYPDYYADPTKTKPVSGYFDFVDIILKLITTTFSIFEMPITAKAKH